MKMKNKINIGVLTTLTLLTMMMTGCSFSVGTTPDSAKANTNAAPANKPANTTATNTAAAPKKDEKEKPKLENEKKPEGKATKAKDVSVPADWIYMYDEAKGYGFSLPAGSTGGSETVDSVNVFMATTPAPSEIGVLVFAFKDAKLSKEDLLDRAEAALKAMGETVQTGKLTGESEDYSVAEATMTSADGTKSKAKVLVGIDGFEVYGFEGGLFLGPVFPKHRHIRL